MAVKRKTTSSAPATRQSKRTRLSDADNHQPQVADSHKLKDGSSIKASKSIALKDVEEVASINQEGPVRQVSSPAPQQSDLQTEFWLMKAEPETRIENGIDVKFSIDDLRSATVPEPWDGVRNHVAKNNMKAMKKGDLGFFYHSNCKIPGIAGILQVAEEADIDESAFNPSHPYYDPKSSRDKPRWYCVKVNFHTKFPELISLKKLQEYRNAELLSMQLLKQGRLSVSKVSKQEWDFIIKTLVSG